MSGDLKWNKIFGAGLATALAILGVREVSTRLFETEPPTKMGYAVDGGASGEAAGGAAEAPEVLPDWGTVLASADVAAGEAVFKKCGSCHNNANGGANQVGPNLWAVVGRPTASHAGFAYSEAMQAHAKAAPAWTYDQLYSFLTKPAKWVPGTKMAFAGIKPAQDKINLIAYLRTQGSSGYAIPAPDPSRQPGAATAAAAAGAAAPAGAGAPAGQAPAAGAAAAPTAQSSAASAGQETSTGTPGQGAVSAKK